MIVLLNGYMNNKHLYINKGRDYKKSGNINKMQKKNSLFIPRILRIRVAKGMKKAI